MRYRVNTQSTDLAVWVGTEDMAAQLGIARRQLLILKANGTLLAGDHWRPRGTGTRRTRLAWDAKSVDRTLRDLARTAHRAADNQFQEGG